MRITLCSGAAFFDNLHGIKKELEERGHEILLPSMIDYHHLEEDALAKIQYGLIRNHLKKIDESHAIYVANYNKNGIVGYIGGNVLLEMGKAFDKSIPIFLMQDIPSEVGYREELIALQPIVVGENWGELDQILCNHYTQKRKPRLLSRGSFLVS